MFGFLEGEAMFALYVLLSLSVVSGLTAVELPDYCELKDRIQGALVGGALGDAFGAVTSRFDTTQEMFRVYGPHGLTSFSQFEATDWLYDSKGDRYVPWTDNTLFSNAQSTILVEGRKRNLTPEQYGDVTARGLLALTNFGCTDLDVQDSTRNRRVETMRSVERLAKMIEHKTTSDWWIRPTYRECRDRTISQEAGSSVLARAWPIGIVYADDPLAARQISKVVTEVTHRHPTAIAASAAIVAGMTYALRGESVDEIVKRMVYSAEQYDRAERVYKKHAVKICSGKGFKRTLISQNAMFTSDMIRYAAIMAKVGASPRDILGDTSKKQDNNRSQRGYLLGYEADEAVAAMVFIFVRNADNLKAAIIEASQSAGQSDIIASLVGALIGARVGYKKYSRALAADIALLEEHTALVAMGVILSDGTAQCVCRDAQRVERAAQAAELAASTARDAKRAKSATRDAERDAERKRDQKLHQDFIEPSLGWSWKKILAVCLGIGVIAGVSYLVYKYGFETNPNP